MASLIQRFMLGPKAPNKGGEDNLREEAFPPFFNENDEKICESKSLEERLVYKIQRLYKDEEKGLRKISADLGAPEPAVPKQEINILIIGNHSSGKSTFINWYVGEDIQKTGVAMETSDFTIVCRGELRETLTASAVMKKFPALQIFEKIPGAIDHLSGEVCNSKKHRFKLVNFIDSPGIVDGPRYDYQFDRAMEACAQMADLIFVFFDPHGQALCQRTMTILERLYKTHPGKLSLWMTKCDTLKDEGDLVKVTQQITREIYRSEEARNLAPMLTPIYVPGHSDNQPPGLNKLSDARSLIDKSIAAHLQNKVLCSIVHHCTYLEKLNAEKLAAEERRHSRGVSGLPWLRAFVYLTIMLTVITIGFYIVGAECLAETLENIVKRDRVLNMKRQFHKSLTEHIQPEMEMPVLAGVLFCLAVLAWLGAREPSVEPVKNGDAIARPWYRNNIDRINNIRQEADQLLRDYLEHVLGA